MQTLKLIYEATCKAMGEDIGSKSRKQHLVHARYVFFHFARKLTNCSLCEIGWVCGQRDHSTVLHGLKNFDRLMKYDDFKSIFNVISLHLPHLESINLTPQQREIKYLYANKARLEKQLEILSKKIDNSEVEKDILNLLKSIPPDKLNDFKETRLKPYLKMNAL